MKSGDLLLRIGDQPIQKPELVCAQLHTAPMPATLDVSRRGDSWRMTVKLGPTPGAHQRVMELCGGDSRMVNATIRGEHAGVKVLRARGALACTGLRAGDLVQRVDGRPVTRPQQMCYALAAAGEAKVVEVSRRGKPVQLRPGN